MKSRTRPRHRLRYALLLFAAGITAAGCASDSGGSNQTPPPALERPDPGIMGDGRLAEILDYVVADTDVPAAAVAFVHQGIVQEQAVAGVRRYGSAAAVTESDRWHLGSLSKSMTATLAAVLIESHVIDWSSTVVDVFPEFNGVIDPAYLDVRLDELMSHTAGIATSSSELAEFVIGEGGSVQTQRYRFAELLLANPPEHSRGSFAYSNAGYILAGAMLERRTGTDWESLMRQYVFGPLGMQASAFGPPGGDAPGSQPTGHIPRRAGWRSIPPDSPDADNPALYGPAGTVHATLPDVAQYMAAHVAGAQGKDVPGFLGAASFEKLHQPMSDDGYALGWLVTETSIFHDGTNNVWFAFITLVPELDIAIFFATNAADPESADGGAPLRAMFEVQEYLQQRFEAAAPGS